MALTCLLDDLGIKDINSPTVRSMLEKTCLPYKNNGEFLKEWQDKKKIYLHACRGILDGNDTMKIKHKSWVEKGRETMKNETDLNQMLNAIAEFFPQFSPERLAKAVDNARKKLIELG